MKVYISGPMTGKPDYNRKEFNDAEAFLKHKGHEVENPARIEVSENKNWKDYMKEAVSMLLKCDAIVLLDGYENSTGANIELGLALRLDYRVFKLKNIEAIGRADGEWTYRLDEIVDANEITVDQYRFYILEQAYKIKKVSDRLAEGIDPERVDIVVYRDHQRKIYDSMIDIQWKK